MCVLYRTRTAYSSSPHPSHHRRGAVCGVCLRIFEYGAVLCFRTVWHMRSSLTPHPPTYNPLSLSLTLSLSHTQLLLAHCTVHVLLCCTSYSPATEHPVHIDRRARDGRLAVDVWLHHHKAAPLSVARVAPRHVVHTPLIAKPPHSPTVLPPESWMCLWILCCGRCATNQVLRGGTDAEHVHQHPSLPLSRLRTLLRVFCFYIC